MGTHSLNLAERFEVGSSAVTSVPTLPLAGLTESSWNWPGRQQEAVYVVEHDFGVRTLTASAVGLSIAPVRQDELHRRIVFGSGGQIEQFSASNISAVLAQPANVLNLSASIFLKCNVEFLGHGGEARPTFLASDPYPPLYEKLDELRLAHAAGVLAEAAIRNAEEVITAARHEGVLPTRILQGAEGVFFYFSKDARYAEIECDNDGDIGFVLSDRSGNPTVWFSESKRLRSDLAKISAFLI